MTHADRGAVQPQAQRRVAQIELRIVDARRDDLLSAVAGAFARACERARKEIIQIETARID